MYSCKWRPLPVITYAVEEIKIDTLLLSSSKIHLNFTKSPSEFLVAE